MGKASLKLKYRVDDILEKHEHIKKLEKSICDNLNMMKQIATLVHQQGELIDSIEENALKAKDYV
jgi:t-SNARE complex subunit (syntaxin)